MVIRTRKRGSGSGSSESWEEASLSSPASSLTLTLSKSAKEVEIIIEEDHDNALGNPSIRFNGDSGVRYNGAITQQVGGGAPGGSGEVDSTSILLSKTGAADRPLFSHLRARHTAIGSSTVPVKVVGLSYYDLGSISSNAVGHTIYGGYNQDDDITSITVLARTGNLKPNTKIRARIVE